MPLKDFKEWCNDRKNGTMNTYTIGELSKYAWVEPTAPVAKSVDQTEAVQKATPAEMAGRQAAVAFNTSNYDAIKTHNIDTPNVMIRGSAPNLAALETNLQNFNHELFPEDKYTNTPADREYLNVVGPHDDGGYDNTAIWEPDPEEEEEKESDPVPFRESADTFSQVVQELHNRGYTGEQIGQAFTAIIKSAINGSDGDLEAAFASIRKSVDGESGAFGDSGFLKGKERSYRGDPESYIPNKDDRERHVVYNPSTNTLSTGKEADKDVEPSEPQIKEGRTYNILPETLATRGQAVSNAAKNRNLRDFQAPFRRYADKVFNDAGNSARSAALEGYDGMDSDKVMHDIAAINGYEGNIPEAAKGFLGKDYPDLDGLIGKASAYRDAMAKAKAAHGLASKRVPTEGDVTPEEWYESVLMELNDQQ